MSKTIKIACKGADEYPYKKLSPTQGDLKELTTEGYEKLKAQILELGFSEPISVWKNGKKLHVLNGHQRLETVRRMIEDEGYKCGPLPVSLVEADDLNQAKRKILALTSQFGHIDDDGLTEFLKGTDIELDELNKYELVDVNVAKFIDEFEAPDTEGNADVETEENVVPQLAQVKTVQLYFDTETADEFQSYLDKISEKYKTESITETILLAVKRAYEKHGATP